MIILCCLIALCLAGVLAVWITKFISDWNLEH